MEEKKLFITRSGEYVTNNDILSVLERSKTYDCKILFMHTALTFGTPNPQMPKNEILQSLVDVLAELKIPTLCVPTFTFSFCNGVDFDVVNSKSKMGVLNEYIRKLPNATRSIDPLMSAALIGEDLDLVTGIGKESIGENSTFAKLHTRDDVKFLFLGTKVGDCFTYMHYMEKFLNVEYRYDRDFKGKITDLSGHTYQDTFNLFVRYKNIFPGNGSYAYEEIMADKGISNRLACGDSIITVVDEPEAFTLYSDLIKQNPNYFLDESRSVEDFDKTFITKDMVAL
jgi:aminoglycoside 3-N-acetyltransferase